MKVGNGLNLIGMIVKGEGKMKKVVWLLDVDVPTNLLGGDNTVILCGPINPSLDDPWE